MPKLKPLTDQDREEIRELLFDDLVGMIVDGIDEITRSRHICSGDYAEAILTVGQAKRVKKQLESALADALADLV